MCPVRVILTLQIFNEHELCQTNQVTRLNCPVCKTALATNKLGRGICYSCAKCQGKAVNLTLLKNISDPKLIVDFWMAAKSLSEHDDRNCPSCTKLMLVHTAPEELGSVELDICSNCQFIWFDAEELEKIPRASQKEVEERAKEFEKPKPSQPEVTPSFPIFPAVSRRRWRKKSLLFDLFEFLVSS
jgi:Zn-finger nucleic acid-binding protein